MRAYATNTKNLARSHEPAYPGRKGEIHSSRNFFNLYECMQENGMRDLVGIKSYTSYDCMMSPNRFL